MAINEFVILGIVLPQCRISSEKGGARDSPREPGRRGVCCRGGARIWFDTFPAEAGPCTLELLKSTTPRDGMVFRRLWILALGSALALPAMAAVPASSRSGHHHPHRRAAHVRRVRHHAHAQSHRLRTHAARVHAHISQVAPAHFVPPLRGSTASLLRQNRRSDEEGLTRIEDNDQLLQLEGDKIIVPLPASSTLRVDPDLPGDRRYCRPWTARFLKDLARSHYARFHRPFQVNSAVRTVSFQRALLEVNGNAAPAEGNLASPHLTGAAVDIGKHGMSFSEIAWMRAHLLPLQTAGKIDVEEEFYQACFHITVYRSYAPPAPPRAIAKRQRSTDTLLATTIH